MTLATKRGLPRERLVVINGGDDEWLAFVVVMDGGVVGAHRRAQKDVIWSSRALYSEAVHQFTVRVSDTAWLNWEAPDPVVPVTVSV